MKISKFTVLSFALALAISLPAAAQSSANNPSSQSAPAQNTPSQPPSMQQNAPSTASPNSAQAQANEDNPLNLTDDQKAKLRPIIADENQQMEALRNDNSMSQAQKIDKANQIRAQASPKIKAILTPEQLQKLAQLQQDRVRQQQQESQQAAPPSNSQTPPSNSQPPQK
jgi:Spy/CpxP family protein refolding chaperone